MDHDGATHVVAEPLAVLHGSGVENVVVGDDGDVPGAHGVGAVGQRLGALVLNIVDVVPATGSACIQSISIITSIFATTCWHHTNIDLALQLSPIKSLVQQQHY